jgi:hypothetical protein
MGSSPSLRAVKGKNGPQVLNPLKEETWQQRKRLLRKRRSNRVAEPSLREQEILKGK